MSANWKIYAHWAKHRLLNNVPLAETPIDIVSYPKSGRTWMRMMLGYVLCEKYNLDKSEILNTQYLTKAASLPKIGFTHAGTGFSVERPPLPVDKLTEEFVVPYAKSRVIFLIRDPRDVLVSSYFHATRRDHTYNAGLDSFIRTDTFGIEKVLKFYNIWYRWRWYPKQFELIRYEDIHDDPVGVISRAMQFIGLDYSDNLIRAATEYAHIDNMRDLEKQKTFDNRALIAGDIDDPESYKARRGVVGGYAEYLSDEDIQYLNRRISSESNSFLQDYLV
jgi:hypothetical protein